MAPGSLKTIGIQAGAKRRIQVTAPGAASKDRAPNCRRARSQAGATGGAAATDTARLWPGNRFRPGTLVIDMINQVQHFEGTTFEADARGARLPAVGDLYRHPCQPRRML